jgi:hypothetical protein
MAAKIQHLSLNAQDPKRAAEDLAALVDGVVTPFHPVDGGYVCFLGDKEDWGGAFVELYPRDIALSAVKGKLEFRTIRGGINASGAHVNLRVPKTRKALEAICAKRRITCSWRDWQSLLEVWLDDDLLVELVPRA